MPDESWTLLNLLGKYLAWAGVNRAPVLVFAGTLAATVALADWAVLGTRFDCSLGFLYIFPILLAASSLETAQILSSAAVFSLLREAFDPQRTTPGRPWRLGAAFLAFAGAGFFVAELDRLRKLAVEHLRLRQASERQSQALVETSPLAVLTLDGEGKVLVANESAHRLLGFHDRQLLGEDIRLYLPVLAHALATKTSQYGLRTNAECRGQRKDGEVFLAQIWFSTYATGEGPRLAAVVWDASENLRDREGAGLDSMMKTSRVLIGAISHEVRNLTCSAITVLDSLGALPDVLPSNNYRVLGSLLKALEKIASSGLQIASKRASEVANVYAVLDETRIIIEPSFRESGGRISWTIQEGLPLVQSDHHSLLQVFLNLARNGLSAMECAETKTLSIEACSERELVVVRFRDTGHGVADPDRLFQPFQAGADSTGLGLYISKETLHSHGGDLRWEAQPVGACFVVELWPSDDDDEA